MNHTIKTLLATAVFSFSAASSWAIESTRTVYDMGLLEENSLVSIINVNDGGYVKDVPNSSDVKLKSRLDTDEKVWKVIFNPGKGYMFKNVVSQKYLQVRAGKNKAYTAAVNTETHKNRATFVRTSLSIGVGGDLVVMGSGIKNILTGSCIKGRTTNSDVVTGGCNNYYSAFRFQILSNP